MKFKKSLLRAKSLFWNRQTFVTIAVILSVLFAYLVLSRIPDHAAVEEHIAANSASSISEIFNNPVNAPYKLLAFTATSISPSVLLIRAVSFVFFAGACVALFWALKKWHTTRVAILATLTFATNSVVLATSRLGTELIAVFGWFIFTTMLVWQIHSRSNKIVPMLVMTYLGILLYTPGALWFFLIIGFVYIDRVKKLFHDVRLNAVLIGSLITVLLITPLVLSFINEPNILKQWLLIPQTLEWSEVPKAILSVPSAFIYQMPEAPLINVGRLPVFDLASGILFLIGLNAYRQKLSLDRTRVMFGIGIVGIILGALGQTITAVILLLPFVFSVIAAGIEYLTDEWRTVFPRNPFARGFGSIIVTVVILFSAYYQLTRFFVVWPQTPETRETYNQSRIINAPLPPDTI